MKTVVCPQCRGLAAFDATNPYRPFCSERCRLIDLGAWASEDYRLPVRGEALDDELSLDSQGGEHA